MYKTIIPGLVTIDTTIKSFYGSYFFKNFDFYKVRSTKSKFNYQVKIDEISIPSIYEFRSGYYLKAKENWYFQRKILGIKFQMRFDEKTKTFYFNRNYLRLPLELGSLLLAGKHIADIINLDLSVAGYVVVRGCAYKKEQKITALIMPSFGGKTTYVIKALQNGARYVAEDILVINKKTNKIFPTMVIRHNYGRRVNRILYVEAKKNNVKTSQQLSSIVLSDIRSTQNAQSKEKTLLNYIILNSLLYMDNRFIRAYIAQNDLASQSLKSVNLSKIKITKVQYASDYKTVNKNAEHWEMLGKDYQKVWSGYAKKAMSKKEMNFITKSIPSLNPVILDVGIGTGRVIHNLIKSVPRSHIYGVDVSNNMIKFSKKRFKKSKQVKTLKVLDISKSNVDFKVLFDAVTAIRVLKYNDNWDKILSDFCTKLKPSGVIVFSMTNRHSLNYFGKYHIAFKKTTIKELYAVTHEAGLKIEGIKTFSRIPDKFYELSSNKHYQRLLIGGEMFLSIFGPAVFGRELFIKARRI